ncbi:MAG TPA: hypothetical protein PKI53_00630 [Candidatus Aminicenantes bacterium]|nr:hypothetical protein [Candidatus Aminicenantes bacterium]HPH42917.1 hypothetical protein [Candidatus Aminicenantes bacterium]
MKRNDFLKAVCGIGLAGRAAALNAGPAGRLKPEEQEKERDRFKEAWLRTLMENMEKTLDPAVRERLMNDCGRECARRGVLMETAGKFQGDIAGFVRNLGPKVGGDLCRVEGNIVHWGYPRCYCELVAAGPERLPDAYCLCSAGWVLEVFEAVAGRPVRVEVVQTIKRGAPDCRFLVRL